MPRRCQGGPGFHHPANGKCRFGDLCCNQSTLDNPTVGWAKELQSHASANAGVATDEAKRRERQRERAREREREKAHVTHRSACVDGSRPANGCAGCEHDVFFFTPTRRKEDSAIVLIDAKCPPGAACLHTSSAPAWLATEGIV